MMVSMSSMNKYVVTIKFGSALSTVEASFEKTWTWEASTPNAIRAGITGIPIKNANMIAPKSHRATELFSVDVKYSLSAFARYHWIRRTRSILGVLCTQRTQNKNIQVQSTMDYEIRSTCTYLRGLWSVRICTYEIDCVLLNWKCDTPGAHG